MYNPFELAYFESECLFTLMIEAFLGHLPGHFPGHSCWSRGFTHSRIKVQRMWALHPIDKSGCPAR